MSKLKTINSIKTMNIDYIKYLIIITLVICILYLVEKIINGKINSDKLELVKDTKNKVDKFSVSTDDYNSNDNIITNLLNLHNNANQNYYNEDNSDLSRTIKNINKVFKKLNPEQRINLSKKKLDELYLKELQNQLNELTNDLVQGDNKINNVNTGIIFNTENITGVEDNNTGVENNNTIQVKYNEDGNVLNNNKCFTYNTDENKLEIKECDITNENQRFKKIYINTSQSFNDNLNRNYNFLETKNDTIPFRHNIIQLECKDCETDCYETNNSIKTFKYNCNFCNTSNNTEECNKCCKKYKKCLTIVKNKNDNAYTTFIEDCNGRSAQQFYKSGTQL